MTARSYADTQTDKEMAHANAAFARHEIARASNDRWLLSRPGESAFWVEVVALSGGHLIVHGDIQAVIFGRYSAGRNEAWPDIARQTVLWMASRERPDDHYFIEKARIGGTANETIWTQDDDVLREEIEVLIAECADDGDIENAASNPRREALKDALNGVGAVTREETQRDVYEALGGDCESVPQGARISCAMIYAHAALQRLARLLSSATVPADETDRTIAAIHAGTYVPDDTQQSEE